jgi:hypothetical protein
MTKERESGEKTHNKSENRCMKLSKEYREKERVKNIVDNKKKKKGLFCGRCHR